MGKDNNALRNRREELGLTQQEVASALGIDRSHYCKIENGDRKATLRIATELAGLLKIEHRNIREVADYFSY